MFTLWAVYALGGMIITFTTFYSATSRLFGEFPV